MQSPQSKSIFFLKEFDSGWIIEKIVRSIIAHLCELGVNAKFGYREEYTSEDIVLHTRSLYFSPVKHAENWVFIFHIDDILKELETKKLLSQVDGVIAMSPSDGAYIRSLAGQLIQNTLPILDKELPILGQVQLRPLVFTYFSECYSDGRKNESWLLSLAKGLSDLEKKAFVIRLLGRGWSKTFIALKKLGVSVELIDLVRSQDFEYETQLEYLRNSDYMLYLGMDGGAMSSYDALVQRVGLIATHSSYHRGLENKNAKRYLVDNEEDFRLIFKQIIKDEYLTTYELINKRSITHYTRYFAEFLALIQTSDNRTSFSSTSNIESTQSVKGQNSYTRHIKPLNLLRAAQACKRKLYSLYNRHTN